MVKVIFLLSLLFQFGYGCAACMLMVPSVEVDVTLNLKEKKLNSLHFTWHFSEIFTNEVIVQYDKNRNSSLESGEIENVRQAFLEYLQPKNMVTTVQYSDENASEATDLHPDYQNFVLKIINNFLILTYDANLHKEIFDNAILSIALVDDEAYFTFNMKQLTLNTDQFAYETNLYMGIASVHFQDKLLSHTLKQKIPSQAIEKMNVTVQTDYTKNEQKSLLQSTIEKIKSLFQQIKDEKNPITYLSLLFFAYLYGVIHALGPGHGKTLVASYFLTTDKSYTKAMFISLAIGVVHTFSAFVLTFIIYFMVSTFLSQFVDDAVFYTTKISALIIIAIALYLLNKKYHFYTTNQQKTSVPQFTFSTNPSHLSSCCCASCKVDERATDIGLILSASIVPCAGTTTLFIFALSSGLFYAGFISAFVMSLGMSSVIFFSALISTMIRKKTLNTHHALKKYLELISLGIILVLGILLLLF